MRWTLRDLRSRWVQVVSTALIVAVGIGAFAGVGGLREWREESTSRSLAALREHDLRVDLAEGGFVPAGRLTGALRDLPDGMLAAAEERLVADSQLDASRRGRAVLLPARIIGMPAPPAGQAVDRLAVLEGRALTASDRDRAVAVLDWNFANRFDLPPSGRVRLAGLGSVGYVGTGLTPQYLVVVDRSGMAGGETGLAVVYMPLAAAQRATGRAGAVNELVLRLAPGQDVARAERAITGALATALPDRGITVTRGAEEAAQRILYRDARNDQKVFLTLAVLVLAGAAFACFNLVSRAVEAQRREIGIGMALGAEPRLLAMRPLMLSAQIAVLGVILGLPVGIALAEWIKAMMKDFFPLPVYARTFPTELYVLGCAIGLLIPLLAAVLPVRRAIAVAPVDAIRTGHRAARGGGATGALRRLSLPGGSLAQLPLRNLARSPRRTVLTFLGLGAVITAIVAVLGMVDAIGGSADRQSAEILRSSPERLQVMLAAPEPAGGPVARRIAAVPGVRITEPALLVGGSVRGPDGSVDVALSFTPSTSRVWRPSVVEGHATADGILLARKAADDLGVAPGDTIVLRHPRKAGSNLAMTSTRVRVAGIHGNPVRALAFLDARAAAPLGLGEIVNQVSVVPAPGARAETIERALFGAAGVGSVQPVRADAEALDATVSDFNSAIQIVVFITLGLALLVAFTSTSVSVDERRREYATMFAFGLPPRTGLRVAIVESVLTGILGTLVGLGLGLAVTGWIVSSLLPETFPDLGAEVVLTTGSMRLTVIVGIGAVGLAPLLTYRRLRTMDVPSTLRVME